MSLKHKTQGKGVQTSQRRTSAYTTKSLKVNFSFFHNFMHEIQIINETIINIFCHQI